MRRRLFRRLKPVSKCFGSDRGQCLDRYYIERFLKDNFSAICGQVLEIADDSYTLKFGGSRVTKSEVLHLVEGNPKATIVADLTQSLSLARNSFDCIIFTQTLQHIYDLKSALKNLYRSLKPGGVILATLPGISQISHYDQERWGDYWRFTSSSVEKLFKETFPNSKIKVKAYGNVLAASSFLYGLAAEELTQKELDYQDSSYELLITARVEKT